MNELLVKANEEIKKVVEYMNENEDMFDMMDLKLHNASFYDYEKDFPLCYKEYEESTNEYNNFYYFCEDNYNMFVEGLKESFNIDFEKMRNQVGRTSKFYLADWIETTHCRLNIENTIDTLLYNYGTDDCIEFNNDNEIVVRLSHTIEDEEVQDELKRIIGFYDYFMDKIKDIEIVYNMIEDFKKNQVEYFKEFLKLEEERLQIEIDEEMEEQEQRKETVGQIKDKYNISDVDMEILKKNIQ